MLCGHGVGRVYLPRVQQLDLEIHCVRVTTSKCARGPPQVHSVLCCAIFYQTTTVPVRSLCTTPNFFYMTVSWYVVPGIRTTVWTHFLDRTGITLYRSFWVRSIVWPRSKCCYVNAAVIEITITIFKLCGSISYSDFDFDDFHMTNARFELLVQRYRKKMKSEKAKMACAAKIYLIFMILCAQKRSHTCTCTYGGAAHAVFTLTQLVDPKTISCREVFTRRYYIIVRYRVQGIYAVYKPEGGCCDNQA